MSLTDVMSESGLVGYAEVAFVISLVTFIAIALWTIRRPREEMEAHARSVLDGDESDVGVARGGTAPTAGGVETSENR